MWIVYCPACESPNELDNDTLENGIQNLCQFCGSLIQLVLLQCPECSLQSLHDDMPLNDSGRFHCSCGYRMTLNNLIKDFRVWE